MLPHRGNDPCLQTTFLLSILSYVGCVYHFIACLYLTQLFTGRHALSMSSGTCGESSRV